MVHVRKPSLFLAQVTRLPKTLLMQPGLLHTRRSVVLPYGILPSSHAVRLSISYDWSDASDASHHASTSADMLSSSS